MSLKTQQKVELEDQGQLKNWWQTVPGILGGIAAVLTATATLVVTVSQAGLLDRTQGDTNQPPEETTRSSVTQPQSKIETLAPLEVAATVVDPDGYTNIRAKKDIESQIISRVNAGAIVYTIPQNGEWWPVRTQSDKHGYIHESRVTLDK
ncbi:MAG: SH3 domain-containing protein [Phormidesmis sp.]|mgnify:CR=1 FL=1